MKAFKHLTLEAYLNELASRRPVPGGGSAAALSSAVGAALVSMVTQYSIGRGKPKAVEARLKKLLNHSERARRRLLELVDLDAKAYLKVVAARNRSTKEKKAAARAACAVPMEVCRLSYHVVDLTPYLVTHGNPHLVSDVQAAVEFLLAGYSAALVMVRINQ